MSYKLIHGDITHVHNLSYSAIEVAIDGKGFAITTGKAVQREVPFNCLINKVRMYSDTNTSTRVDIWRDIYANFPPTDADSITAAATPNIASGARKSQNTTLTGWITTLTKAQTLIFNVDVNTSAKVLNIVLEVTPT